MRVAVEQHLRALDQGPDDIVYLNASDGATGPPRRGQYDAVVLHTTFLCLRWDPLFGRRRRAWSWLGELDCPKIALPQDEYDHAAVLDDWLDELGVDTVYSCFGETTRSLIYPLTSGRARFAFALTGYFDRDAAEYMAARARPHAERSYDIVYRALQLPYWFGSHGQLKHRIALAVSERAPAHGLRTDISTRPEDTIFGYGWLDFVMSGRATVGVESGSSVLDRRGEVQRRIRELLAIDSSLTFEEIDMRMPEGWDAYAFFAISPRHLEAVMARTCQVLVEGTYSGVLEADRHYIPVRRDLSDLDRALECLGDAALVKTITDRAYEEIYLRGAWTTDDFAASLRQSLGARSAVRRRRRSPTVPHPLGIRRVARSTDRVAGIASAVHIALVGASSLFRRPLLARVMTRVLASREWRDVLKREVARDLVRLGALDRFERHQAEMHGPWRVRSVLREEELVLLSEREPVLTASRVVPKVAVRQITWDHSNFGTTVPLDPRRPSKLLVGLGGGGRYRFEGLSTLARSKPDLRWAEAILTRR